MAKKRYRAEYTVTVEFDVEEELLEMGVKDPDRNQYGFKDVEDVAVHLAYNLAQNRDLSSLDGFADRHDSEARLVPGRNPSWDLDTLTELTTKKKAGR